MCEIVLGFLLAAYLQSCCVPYRRLKYAFITLNILPYPNTHYLEQFFVKNPNNQALQKKYLEHF